MAAAHVQSDLNTGQSGATATVAFGANTVTGNAIVVCVFWKTDVTIDSVTDVEGNTYEDCGQGRESRPTDGFMQILGAPNITGATTPTITVNFSGSATEIDMYILEYSGIDTSDLFDATSDKGTATTGSTVVTDNAYNPVNTDGVLICFGTANGNNAAPVAFTGGETYTTREVSDTNQGAQGVGDAIYTSDIGTEQTTCTFSGTITKGVMIVGILNTAAAAAAVPGDDDGFFLPGLIEPTPDQVIVYS